jgi:peptide/nickel transport system permease protein
MGLDGTIPEQLAGYLRDLITGDLGTSLVSGERVVSTLARTVPVTAWLVTMTTVAAIVVAVPLALAIALRKRRGYAELSFDSLSSILLATPVFFSGLVLILIFSVRLKWLPVAGYEPEFPGNVRYLVLPAVTLCLTFVPVLARVLNRSIAATLDEEFVEAAVVRGLPRWQLYWHYLTRPSVAPSIALIAYIVGQLLGAAVVVESIFGIPGLGSALIDAVRARDYTAVQGIVMFCGLAVVVIGFVADLVSEAIDPRMRTSSP